MASNHWPEGHYTVYITQNLALITITTGSAKFSSIKFCCYKALMYIFVLCHGHILNQSVIKHMEFNKRSKYKHFCVKITP